MVGGRVKSGPMNTGSDEQPERSSAARSERADTVGDLEGSRPAANAPAPAGKPAGAAREGESVATRTSGSDSGTGPRGEGENGAESGKGEELALGSRAPQFVQQRRTLHLSWQVGVFVLGLAVVVAGALMLVLPGPGWVVIFGGMAIWATEFVWAQLVLRWTKRKVTEAAKRALDPRVRRRNIILTVVGLVIVAAVILVYVVKFGLELPWNIDR